MAKKGRGSRRHTHRRSAPLDVVVATPCYRWDCPDCRPDSTVEYGDAPPPDFVFRCEHGHAHVAPIPTWVAGLHDPDDPHNDALLLLCDSCAESTDLDPTLSIVGWLPFTELAEEDRNAHWRRHYALTAAD